MAGVPYAKLVGSLNFLSSCTRPDISCPVSILSRFVAEGKARRKHWEAAKRVLRYLKGTATHGVTLGGTNPIQLQAYADASWADDLQDRKSTLRVLYLLGSRAHQLEVREVFSSSTVHSRVRVLCSWGSSKGGGTPQAAAADHGLSAAYAYPFWQ